MSQTHAFVGPQGVLPLHRTPHRMSDTSLPTTPNFPTPNGPLVTQGVQGLLLEGAQALADAKAILETIDTAADAISDPTLKASIKASAGDGVAGIGGTRLFNEYAL